jgi:8-oxo-dGTP diphosphatase
MSRPITPALAVDAIIEMIDRPERPIVLIERRYPPPGWAIPGGFVDVGETVEDAAVREAREETGLVITLQRLLGVYSDPARDPRGHTVTVTYIATASGNPEAADDAKHLGVFSLEQIPSPLAFDHDMVLRDYRAYRERGVVRAVRSSK